MDIAGWLRNFGLRSLIRGKPMDVFKAVNSRIACRHFLDQHVDPDIVRRLVEGAANAASSSNLQPWNVYAVTGEPLREIKRQAVDAIEKRDWRTLEAEYPDMPENLWEPYLSRRFVLGAHLYGSLGINRDDKAGRLEMAKRNFQFFNAPVGLFITIDRGLGPGQWADLGGYVSTLALLARGYGLDSCPQVMWIRVHKIVGAILKIPAEQMLYCGIGIGYGDRSHPINNFRRPRAPLDEFCKFFGFD